MMDDTDNNDYLAIGFRQDDNPSAEMSTPISDPLAHSLTPVIRFFLVILLRIGFLLVQVGSIPITNINLILLQNVLDICWTSIVFMMLGTVIAYTGTHGIIGGGYWVGHEITDKEEIMIGWEASIIASAISTTCIVGRMHTLGSVILGIIVSGFLQPFIIHWIWTTNGWMAQNNLFNYNVYFRDYGGSTVVHIFGGLTGLISCVALGRRLLRLRDIDNASISFGSATAAFSGHLFIVTGLQALLLSPSSVYNNEKLKERIPIIPINNLMSISSCAIVVVALHFVMRDPFNHWTVMRCIQGVTAGAIIVSAGVDVYTPAVCIALGCLGGVLFYLSSKLIFRSALEDYCNTISLHVIVALVGSLVAPFFYDNTSGDTSFFGSLKFLLINFIWKIICLLCIFLFVFIIIAPLFYLLNWVGLLRNRSEFLNHLRSMAAMQHAPSRPFTKRLFEIHEDSILVQPGISGQTFEIISGRLSTRFNRTVTRLEIDDIVSDETRFNNNNSSLQI